VVFCELSAQPRRERLDVGTEFPGRLRIGLIETAKAALARRDDFA
jgi:hypothetical protein